MKAFYIFNKVIGARPEKTKKIKAESKKQNKKRTEGITVQPAERNPETKFSSMKCEFTILLYLFSVFVFYIWIQLTYFSLFQCP